MSTPERWAVVLEGDSLDNESAARLFGDGPIRVRKVEVRPGKRETALLADDLETLDRSAEVHASAERLLDLVNAMLLISDANRLPLRMRADSVRERGPSGIWDRQHALIRGEVISSRLRSANAFGTATVTGGAERPERQPEPGQAPSFEARCLELVLREQKLPWRDRPITDVLAYLRGDPDWANLYMAYDRIAEDIGAAGRKRRRGGRGAQRPIAPWAKKERSEFTASAQPFRHGNRQDWAGRTPNTAIPLEEARARLLRWTRDWLEQKLRDAAL
ncbi:hypothetical protein [Roseomonas sp. AR75]|uniref:hypothetical protein n=1 Tax=Roseomonas sp. AR75 TaxID=2562311 RepID=UPI0010BF6D35|nr:hypothetical protein [Roseomonas sp. AR75]